MSPAMTSAYQMARQGYGWEDIQAKNPSLPKAMIWDVLEKVYDKGRWYKPKETGHG